MNNPPFKPQEWFSARADNRDLFLSGHGWYGVVPVSMGDDGAFRRYARLRRDDGASAILMEAMPDGHPHATPGHRLSDFIRLGSYLRSIGLATPQIYAADEAEGYVLLEDFGDLSFRQALAGGAVPQHDLYALATDVLSWLRQKADQDDVVLPDYYASHVHTGRRRVVDWYLPAIRGYQNADGLGDDYLAVWDGIERGLAPVQRGVLHIDYHFENLMWRPDQSGLARCGILDFQGAMAGPVPYDLANVLEDARVDVPADLRAAMLDRYIGAMPPGDRDNFRGWYRVLATQFHCRVIGQFIRMAVRDGKTRYLPMIPRVAGYIRDGLKDPVLKPLAGWFAEQGVDFTVTEGFRPDVIRGNIRPDAF